MKPQIKDLGDSSRRYIFRATRQAQPFEKHIFLLKIAAIKKSEQNSQRIKISSLKEKLDIFNLNGGTDVLQIGPYLPSDIL